MAAPEMNSTASDQLIYKKLLENEADPYDYTINSQGHLEERGLLTKFFVSCGNVFNSKNEMLEKQNVRIAKLSEAKGVSQGKAFHKDIDRLIQISKDPKKIQAYAYEIKDGHVVKKNIFARFSAWMALPWTEKNRNQKNTEQLASLLEAVVKTAEEVAQNSVTYSYIDGAQLRRVIHNLNKVPNDGRLPINNLARIKLLADKINNNSGNAGKAEKAACVACTVNDVGHQKLNVVNNLLLSEQIHKDVSRFIKSFKNDSQLAVLVNEGSVSGGNLSVEEEIAIVKSADDYLTISQSMKDKTGIGCLSANEIQELRNIKDNCKRSVKQKVKINDDKHPVLVKLLTRDKKTEYLLDVNVKDPKLDIKTINGLLLESNEIMNLLKENNLDENQNLSYLKEKHIDLISAKIKYTLNDRKLSENLSDIEVYQRLAASFNTFSKDDFQEAFTTHLSKEKKAESIEQIKLINYLTENEFKNGSNSVKYANALANMKKYPGSYKITKENQDLILKAYLQVDNKKLSEIEKEYWQLLAQTTNIVAALDAKKEKPKEFPKELHMFIGTGTKMFDDYMKTLPDLVKSNLITTEQKDEFTRLANQYKHIFDRYEKMIELKLALDQFSFKKIDAGDLSKYEPDGEVILQKRIGNEILIIESRGLTGVELLNHLKEVSLLDKEANKEIGRDEFIEITSKDEEVENLAKQIEEKREYLDELIEVVDKKIKNEKRAQDVNGFFAVIEDVIKTIDTKTLDTSLIDFDNYEKLINKALSENIPEVSVVYEKKKHLLGKCALLLLPRLIEELENGVAGSYGLGIGRIEKKEAEEKLKKLNEMFATYNQYYDRLSDADQKKIVGQQNPLILSAQQRLITLSSEIKKMQ